MPQTLFNFIYPKFVPIRGFVTDLDVVKKQVDAGNEKVMKFNLEGNSLWYIGHSELLNGDVSFVKYTVSVSCHY